jgi:hypothetical protein
MLSTYISSQNSFRIKSCCIELEINRELNLILNTRAFSIILKV